jgi:hypothetical protein
VEEDKRFYCSELSRRAQERPCGTASIGTSWLLLEYPHGWGRNAFEESVLTTVVKHHLSSAGSEGRRSRLLFIKTDRGRRDRRMNFFVIRCRERAPYVVRFQLETYEDVTKLDLRAVAQGNDLQGGVVSDEPLFLVCTHGKRDKCCAKFGIPLFNALRELAGDSVWQSSHVGGDRFAGNLVCFPHGLFYAHVNDTAGRRIVIDYLNKKMVLDSFRGRANYSHPVQAAEYFVRCEAELFGVEELRFLSSTREGEKEWHVKFISEEGDRLYEARLQSRLSEFSNLTTCNASAGRPVAQFSLEEYRFSRGSPGEYLV